MSMRRRFQGNFSRLLVAWLVWSGMSLSVQVAQGQLPQHEAPEEQVAPLWAHENSDIPVDPRITFGVLDNGLRYVLLPNAEPPERISLRLWVNVGSFHEEDHQQGLAHFLEHAAFLGTTDFDVREQKEYFQRLGMKFGADTNAHTSFMETAYKLELPDNNEQLLKDAFRLLRGYATDMLIPEDEVLRERGVVLSELRDRDGAGYRTLVNRFEFLLAGTRLVTRFPIGKAEIIAGATADLLRDLYEKWYVPERMVLIVVGDMDVELVESLLKTYFSEIPAGAHAIEEPDSGQLLEQGEQVGFHRESEYEVAQIGLYQLDDYEEQPDTQQSRAMEIVIALANDMLTQRFSRLAMQEDAKFASGYAMYDEGYLTYQMAGVGVAAQPRYWKEGMEIAATELQRAIQHGFMPVEFEEAKARYLRGLEAAVEGLPSTPSDELANALMRSIADHYVYSHPEYNLGFGRQVLDSVPLEQVNAVFAELWQGDAPKVFLTGNLPDEVTVESIQSVFQQAWELEPEAPVDLERPVFAYREFGEPGKIVGRQHVEDLDLHTWELANGIRVNLKVTDFENDRIYTLVRVDGGMLELPADKPGLAMFADMGFVEGGLGQHSIQELQRVFAGKLVGAEFSVESDAYVLSGVTTGKEIEEQLQLLAAYLTDPGFRNEGVRVVKERLPMLYSRYQQTPEGNWNYWGNRLLYEDDHRLNIPVREQVEAVGMNDLREWLAPALQSNFVEVSIIGDFDVAALEPLVLRTLGALPARKGTPAQYRDHEVAQRKEPSGLVRHDFVSQFPRALAVVVWPSVNYWEVDTKRKLRLVSEVMIDHLDKRLRGELGDVYSPYAYVRDDEAFSGFGDFIGISLGSTENVEVLAKLIREIGGELAAGNIDEDALARARQPMLKQIRDIARNNNYWLQRVLARAQSRPEMLDHARNLLSSYEGYTLDEVRETAAQFLKPELASLLLFVPVAEEKSGSEEEAASQESTVVGAE